uniref:Retrovirus-related Pol polyprotein from transposon 17.6 n=1 Tax=Tanacetum cinerariifolium TaxID=118510 RepID=A0A6L2K3Q2_TANCI|nr:retrovirus-related Pol polyprotein from transposon 17.6 [Tanacetum cinerariifolium]
MIHMPKGAKVLKDLLSHKEKLEKAASSVKLSEECSNVIQKGISELKPTKMSIQLADHSLKHPIEMDEDESVPIILGRPFLETARAVIDTVKFVHDQWMDIVYLDGKWIETDQNHEKAQAVFFHPRHEVEPFESRAPKNRLKPSIQELPKLELKELPEHIEKLNDTTRKDHFSLPFIDWMLERLAGYKYYCFLDGLSGYFQVLIAPEDQEKTTFTCPYGPLLINKDAKTMRRNQPGPKLGEVPFHAKLPQPTNVTSIRSFLGHAGIYRRFIKDFSQVARPLTQLLVKDAPFIFSKECMQAFEKLKHELTQAPVMIKPDWSLPFKVMCDDSDYVVGAVLGQRINNHFQPIHYANKTMNATQENYTITKKELLAVVFAFDKF